jgi:hypothetical protein
MTSEEGSNAYQLHALGQWPHIHESRRASLGEDIQVAKTKMLSATVRPATSTGAMK